MSNALRIAGTLLLLAAFGACGSGASSSVGTGASDAGGAAGADAPSGGVSGFVGAGGATGGGATGGISDADAADGSGGCGLGMGGTDCNDPCTGAFYLPTCVDGVWGCYGTSNCDASGGCTTGEVMTPSGCVNCADAKSNALAAVAAAKGAHDSCSDASDCVFEAMGICVGFCPQAIKAAEDDAYLLELQQIAQDYCATGLIGICGFEKPDCPTATLACTGGHCEPS